MAAPDAPGCAAHHRAVYASALAGGLTASTAPRAAADARRPLRAGRLARSAGVAGPPADAPGGRDGPGTLRHRHRGETLTDRWFTFRARPTPPEPHPPSPYAGRIAVLTMRKIRKMINSATASHTPQLAACVRNVSRRSVSSW